LDAEIHALKGFWAHIQLFLTSYVIKKKSVTPKSLQLKNSTGLSSSIRKENKKVSLLVRRARNILKLAARKYSLDHFYQNRKQ
jgi:hypothetical protein